MPAFVAFQFPIEDKLHRSPVQPVLFAEAQHILPGDSVTSRRDKGELAFYACKAPSSLGEHISHIVSVRANKQMVGTHTNRIVAFVANVQRAIKFSVGKFVREAMRIFSGVTAILINKKASVLAFRLCFAAPYPAISRLFDFAPESFFKGKVIAHARNNTPPHSINQVNSWGGYAYSHA